MDFWLVAAVAGAGYLSKYWQSISQDNKNLSQLSSSGDPNYNKLESDACRLRGLTNRPRQRRNVARDKTGFTEDAFDGSVLNLQSGLSGNEGLEEYDDFRGSSPSVSVEEMDCCGSNGSTTIRSSLRTKFSHARCVKPMNSLESCLMAQLCKERDEMKEYVLSSLPSPASTTMRPLFVTDGRHVISKSHRNSCSAQSGTDECKFSDEACLGNDENVHDVPALTRIGSVESVTKAKALTGKRQKGKVIGGKDFDPLDGSPGGTALLCLGISIGIMANFMTNKREVDKLKELLKQTENLVQDLQEELEMKDSLTVKELVNESYESQDTTSDDTISKRVSDTFSGGPNADSSTRHGDEDCTQKAEEGSESISKIEAELEAELERLGLNMNASNLERRSSDIDEIDAEFMVDFSQGELTVDMLGVEDVAESKLNRDGASTSTTTRDTGNYAVSSRELSLRLHEVIQSRLEERVNELETALQNSHRKIRIMESGGKNNQLRKTPIAKEPKNPVPGPPLVVNLSGDALDAYNETREELMRLSDSEEEDSPQRVYEDNDHCSEEESSHGAFQSRDEGIFGSAQNHETPEHISLVLGSNDTMNSRDEISDCDDEVERELIKQIVERTKKGSSVVVNAQRLLFSMEDN